MRLRFGLAAWSNRHFDHALYPLGTLHAEWLPRYSTLFDVAEADILHHQAAEEGTLKEWVDSTPDGFLFLPKMHKDATHGPTMAGTGRLGKRYAWLRPELPSAPSQQALGQAPASGAPSAGPGAGDKLQADLDRRRTEHFLASVDGLRQAGRLGPTLVQFAPSLERDTGWDRLMAILSSAEPGTFAVEFRHPSWFVPAVERVLEDFEAPLVWSTYPGAFAPPWRTADRGYLRFTGTHRPKRGRHIRVADRAKEVQEIARRLDEASWRECFVIVTNPFEGNAVDSMPVVVEGLAGSKEAARFRHEPAGVLFPGPAGPRGKATAKAKDAPRGARAEQQTEGTGARKGTGKGKSGRVGEP